MNNTKEAIFESAIKIFSINGYNGATMDDIAQNAGVAKGTLYYHFKSKEEIFSFIIKHGLEIIKTKTLSRIEQEENEIDKLRVFCLAQLNLVNEHKDFLKVVISQLWGENTRHLELRNEIFEYAKILEGYVKIAIENNLIKNENSFLLSCSILGSVCSLAIHDLILNDKLLEQTQTSQNLMRRNGDQVLQHQGNVSDSSEDINKLIEFLLYGIGVKKSTVIPQKD